MILIDHKKVSKNKKYMGKYKNVFFSSEFLVKSFHYSLSVCIFFPFILVYFCLQVFFIVHFLPIYDVFTFLSKVSPPPSHINFHFSRFAFVSWHHHLDSLLVALLFPDMIIGLCPINVTLSSPSGLISGLDIKTNTFCCCQEELHFVVPHIYIYIY